MWRIAAGALGGCCSILCLSHDVPAAVLAAAGAFVLAAGLRWRRGWLVAWALAMAYAGGELILALHDRLDPALEGRTLQLRGVVTSVPQGTAALLRFRFRPDAAAGDAEPLPRTIELTWYDAPVRVAAAARLELEVRLRRPRGFANPGGQDNEARMLRERIGAAGYVRSGTVLGRASAWRHPVLLARACVHETVRAALGERPAAGIVSGLAVGLQDALSRQQWLTLARSGTSHLMAISGLHIAMVAALAAWCGARCQRWRQRRGATAPQRDIAVLAGAVAAFGYSLLAGWSVPTQRTIAMLAVAALALALRRRVGIADGLGACALLVLVGDPLAPLAPGFWLSFGAVAVILAAATGHVRRPTRLGEYLRVQAAVTIGLVPMLVGSFGTVSLVSVLVNLYAIPLYTLVIVPAVLVSCAVASLWREGGTVLLQGTAALVEVTWPAIEVPASWPGATWAVAGLEPLAWVALLVGVAAVLAPLAWPGRVAGATLVVAACLWRPPLVPAGHARITVLDVGQGLAVVVETRHHVLLFDTGPSFRTGTDAGQLVVVPYLRHRGVRRLDRLVASHDDDDHTGGVASVLGLLPVHELVTGPSVPATAYDGPNARPVRSTCRRGERWSRDGVEFAWLHPGPTPYARDNDSSCVLRVRAGARTALITGDIERRAEADLLSAVALQPVDVLVVPHHGSRTSSTAEFVARTHPAWAVYAVGHRNRWNFPAPVVLERWRAVGAQPRLTSTGGAIVFELRPGRPVAPPAQWRIDRHRIWRDP